MKGSGMKSISASPIPTADPEKTTVLEPGSFFAYPPGMVHYAQVEGETVIQLNSTGPWTITYVNDSYDPRM